MKRFVKTLLHNLLLAFLAFVWLVPIVWLVVTSFSAYTGMNTSTKDKHDNTDGGCHLVVVIALCQIEQPGDQQIHFLQRIYRHEYQHLFPEGMESGAV